jgi:hypothetical protein
MRELVTLSARMMFGDFQSETMSRASRRVDNSIIMSAKALEIGTEKFMD